MSSAQAPTASGVPLGRPGCAPPRQVGAAAAEGRASQGQEVPGPRASRYRVGDTGAEADQPQHGRAGLGVPRRATLSGQRLRHSVSSDETGLGPATEPGARGGCPMDTSPGVCPPHTQQLVPHTPHTPPPGGQGADCREMCVPPGVGGPEARPASNQGVALSLVLTAGEATSALGTPSLTSGDATRGISGTEEAGVSTGSFHSPACLAAPQLVPCPSGLGSPRTPVGEGVWLGPPLGHYVQEQRHADPHGGRGGTWAGRGQLSGEELVRQASGRRTVTRWVRWPQAPRQLTAGPPAEPRWGRLPLGLVPD